MAEDTVFWGRELGGSGKWDKGADVCVTLADEKLLGCKGVPPYKPSLIEHRCSGNGYFPDSDFSLERQGGCVCGACFAGDSCEIELPFDDEGCEVYPDDPEMRFYREWYDMHPEAISIFYPSYGMEYRQVINVASSSNPLSAALYNAIRAVHEAVGNVDFSDDYQVIVGMGAHQVVAAAINALSRNGHKTVVAQIPHWSRFKDMSVNANTMNATWWDRNEDLVPENEEAIIEIVTQPNNPDNKYPKPRFDGSTKIHDFVYFWPNQQHPDKIKPRSEDIMVYSMSKIGSMPDVRIGWAFVKDKAIADLMKKYISGISVGPPGPSLLRTVKILQAVLSSSNDGDNEFFQFGYKKLADRFEIMKALIEESEGKFSLVSEFGVFFMIKCNEFDGEEDAEISCQNMFHDAGIKPRLGSRYGYQESESIIMTCIGDSDHDFGIFRSKFEHLAMPEK